MVNRNRYREMVKHRTVPTPVTADLYAAFTDLSPSAFRSTPSAWRLLGCCIPHPLAAHSRFRVCRAFKPPNGRSWRRVLKDRVRTSANMPSASARGHARTVTQTPGRQPPPDRTYDASACPRVAYACRKAGCISCRSRERNTCHVLFAKPPQFACPTSEIPRYHTCLLLKRLPAST